MNIRLLLPLGTIAAPSRLVQARQALASSWFTFWWLLFEVGTTRAQELTLLMGLPVAFLTGQGLGQMTKPARGTSMSMTKKVLCARTFLYRLASKKKPIVWGGHIDLLQEDSLPLDDPEEHFFGQRLNNANYTTLHA